MAGLESTYLWQSTLAKQLEPDNTEQEREFFRVNYESFRRNAGLLAAEISRDLPDYTVHDLTHLDALWEMASIICGENYSLNPAEAFVLGGAFLVHDLGMGLAAYPDGVDDLKKNSLWSDTIAHLEKTKKALSSNEIEKQAIEIVLRGLHAKHAEKLALISWGKTEKHYLISDPELREAYGAIIGLIAHSHWWGAGEILQRFNNSLGALGDMPNEWGIDPVKLACIMRVSDAAHIDCRRAPAILKAFRQPNEYAEQHWLFQQRLYQPRLESERLIYTSKTSFAPTESKSWWLCFDTLKMIDKELRDVDSILGDTKRMRFKAKGVAAINNIPLLSRLIGTEGWQPVDTSIHVGNVAKLVKNLGGEQLYGKNKLVPLRELIQNACDAVRARRILENEPPDWGQVTVRTGNDKLGAYIEVEDNGVGMSTEVLSGPFLDFGTSFWGTPMMHSELPGLESKGFISTGKYGVGFFSTFMWGDYVTVTTRRFESARQDTKVLVFERGLTDRPILRNAQQAEYIKDGGTRIRVYFSSSSTYEKIFRDSHSNIIELNQVIEDLCPCLDTKICAENSSQGKSWAVAEANDWETLISENFVRRALGNGAFKNISDQSKQEILSQSGNIRNIIIDNKIIGRGFIYKAVENRKKERFSIEGAVTVGGFRTSGLSHIIGLFVGETARASRDIGEPIANGEALMSWASEQASLTPSNSPEKVKFEIASIIRAMRGNPGNLFIAKHQGNAITASEFRHLVKENLKEIIIASHSSLSLIERKTKKKIKLKNNVFVVECGIPGILQARNENYWPDWPFSLNEWFHDLSLEGFLIEEFSEAWGVSLEAVRAFSSFSTDDISHDRAIGHIDDEEIIDTVDIIRATAEK